MVPDPRVGREQQIDPADLADLDRLDSLSGPADLARLVGTPPDAGPAVRLRGGADLITALPVLLGFHPRDSLVLVAIGGRSGRRVGLTVRVDLPPPGSVDEHCAQAVEALLSDDPVAAIAVVVGGGRPGSAGSGPPRAGVAVAVSRLFAVAGVESAAVLWAAGTGAGERWACYDLPGQRCGCTGILDDPSSSPAAAAGVRQGRVVLPDRAAVAEILATEQEPTLRRRAGLRSAEVDRAGARAAAGEDPGPEGIDEHRALLRQCLDEAARCRLVVDDRTVLAFCAAFDVPDLRDEAVRCCLGPDAPHAEQLWAALFRAMPAPECAHPAALFATCALLRGDGALAAIALERAFAAFPAHRLAGIVAAVLDGMAGPTALRELLERAYGRPE